MNQTMKLSKKEYQPFVEAWNNESGRPYTGIKVKVEFANRVYLSDTNWSGGTKSTYLFFNMDTSKAKSLIVPAPWINKFEGENFALPENLIVIEHCWFCGKDLGLTIYAHPSRQQAFLGAGQ